MKKLLGIILITAVGLMAAALVFFPSSEPLKASSLVKTSAQMQDKIGSRYAIIYKEEDRSKLIKHSHKFHATKGGAECKDCHASITSSEKAMDSNLPKMDACYECHDKETTDCKLCHLEPKEPYSSYKAPKRELTFNHKAHLGMKNVNCETCHSEITNKAYTGARTLPAMESCMGCHDGAQASNDCKTCHTDIRFIKPADHMAGFMRTHKHEVATQGDANCRMCHSTESCEDCHNGGNLNKMKNRNEFSPSGTPSGMSENSSQIISKAHALDFIFTHRFDAKAKTSECQTCHEAESFCVQCHNNNDKMSKPAWHKVAGFTSGVGGGLHAQLAKKDMENCVSCHNIEGQDPTCYTCHKADGSLKNF